MIDWLLSKIRKPIVHPLKTLTLVQQSNVIKAAGVFDEAWYLKNNADVRNSGLSPLAHYLTFGWKEGRDPSFEFSTRFYIEQNPDVQKMGLNPLFHYCVIGRRQRRLTKDPHVHDYEQYKLLVAAELDNEFYRNQLDPTEGGVTDLVEHYFTVGCAKGLDPTPYFSTSYYLSANRDVAMARVNAFAHYLAAGRREGRLPKSIPGFPDELLEERRHLASEFDPAYYLSTYPDVAAAKLDPLHHFMLTGWLEGRDPSSNFSVDHYLAVHTDVRNAGINPLFHYVTEGRKEGRDVKSPSNWIKPTEVARVVSEEFDADHYRNLNPDVTLAGLVPLDHFLSHGWTEGRNPNNWFSCNYYLDANPDVARAGINPFYHYLIAGKTEGRQTRHPGGWRAEKLQKTKTIRGQIKEAREYFATSGGSDHADYRLQTELELVCRVSDRAVICVSQDNYTTSVGGVQLCIGLEERAARAKNIAYVNIHPETALPVLSPEFDGQQSLIVVCNGRTLGSCSASKLLDVLASTLGRLVRTDLVVHSLLGHSTEFVSDLHKAIKPRKSIYWLHDYLGLCPSFTLLRNGIAYCGAPDFRSISCEICVYGAERVSHRDRLKKLFCAIEFIIVSPSEFTKRLWTKCSPPSEVEPMVQPHCVLTEHQPKSTNLDGNPLRVAFIGHPAPHKGWNVFENILNEFGHSNEILFYHFGSGAKCHRHTEFIRVSVVSDGPTAMVEALKRAKIDIVLLWSIWPETFSLVAYETLASGASIVCNSTSGNVADLVRSNGRGLVLEDETELIHLLRSGALAAWRYENYVRVSCTGDLEFSEMSVGFLTTQEDGEAES